MFYLHACLCTMCIPGTNLEAKTGHPISWNWCYRPLCASMWVICKPRSSARAVKYSLPLSHLPDTKYEFFKLKIIHFIFSTYFGFFILMCKSKSTIFQATGKQRNYNTLYLFVTIS